MNDELAGQVLEALNDKVDIDYGNMPANSTNYAPSSKNVTNCITEIPQDIKLEYSGNTITLKSGSKTYVPNGSGVFANNVYTQDKSVSFLTGLNGSFIIFAGQSANSDIYGQRDICFYSGTNPTISTNVAIWYDTTNNIIKFSANGGSTWDGKYSFPLAIVTVSNGEITSIDQVFNGFGYIGSTAFVLPGVKGLAPYGRNDDGTLKNLEMNVKNVLTTTDVSGATGGLWYILYSYAIVRVNFGTFTYDKEKNKYRDNNSGSYNNTFILIDSSAYRKDGRVEKFNPIMPLSITDRSDTDFIANQAFPSDRYVDLTLGASSSYYTAPADGWFYLRKSATAAGQYVYIEVAKMSIDFVYTTSNTKSYIMPCKRGDRLLITYTTAGATTSFRFIYANGSK